MSDFAILKPVGDGVRAKNDRVDVALVQGLLKANGLNPGRLDGVYEPRTSAAIRDFQRIAIGRPAGLIEPGRATWIKLSSAKFALYPGVAVVLPNQLNVDDPHSKTGLLMSPVPDLRPVAEAGRAVIKQFLLDVLHNPTEYSVDWQALRQAYGKNVGTGGLFDYQRVGSPENGYIQFRQFRDVSNFNAGLFGQQARAPKSMLLKVAGDYAKGHSSNYDAHNPPYFLDARTQEFIEKGFDVGAT